MIAIAAVFGLAGTAGATRRHTTRYTESGYGAEFKGSGTSFENALELRSSVDGSGAGVQIGHLSGTAFPLHGTDTTRAYYEDGVSVATDTYTITAPTASGLGTISGRGHCVRGTRVHKHEKCSYTFKGSFNPTTRVSFTRLKGSTTR